MNTLTINVEVGLKEDTIQRIAAILGGVQTRPMQAPSAPPLPPKPEAREEPKPAEAPKPEGPKAASISNIVLNNAVKDAQTRGVTKDAILSVFAKYGIEKSRDCAEDRRADLLSDLNALK